MSLKFTHIERFLAGDKWRLEVRHVKAGFHAAVWCPQTNEAHNYIDDSVNVAVSNLNVYLADKQP